MKSLIKTARRVPTTAPLFFAAVPAPVIQARPKMISEPQGRRHSKVADSAEATGPRWSQEHANSGYLITFNLACLILSSYLIFLSYLLILPYSISFYSTTIIVTTGD